MDFNTNALKIALGNLWHPQYNPFAFIFIFSFGVLGAGISALLPSKKHVLYDVLYALMILLFLFLIYFGPEHSNFGALDLPYKRIPTLAICIMLALIAGPRTSRLSDILEPPTITWIAKLSFGIYLYHYVIMELIKECLVSKYHYAGMNLDSQFMGISVAVFVATILCAQLSWSMLEKPGMKRITTMTQSTKNIFGHKRTENSKRRSLVFESYNN